MITLVVADLGQIASCVVMARILDNAVWDPTVFTKNRQRLLDREIAPAFLEQTALADSPGTTRAATLNRAAGLLNLVLRNEDRAAVVRARDL